MSAKKMKQVYNSDKHHKTLQKRQLYDIRKLNQKLLMENKTFVQADKGKPVVVINSDDYDKKVQTILTDNNFHIIQKDLTVK